MANDEKVDILVVDDLPEKLLIYNTVLEGLGQNIVTALSGREALRLLLEREFAVILLDVNMPDMDGFETAAMIRSRRRTAHTPIIFVTAFSDDMHTAQGYSLGAVDYILSPIVPEILRTKVGVFVDLFKKTLQVRRQAEEHVALARAEAARAAAEAANRRSAFLAEASRVLVQSLDQEAIARGLVRQAVPFLGDLCALALTLDPDDRHVRTELAWIDPSQGSCHQTTRSPDQPLDPLAIVLSRVVEHGAAEFHPQIAELSHIASPGLIGDASDPTGAARPGKPCDLGSCSVFAAPLKARGQTLGALAVARRQPGPPFGPDDLALAEDLAARASVAVENARLYHHVQENDRRKNEFLAMLAHELRNPLAPIRSAVELLRLLELEDQNVVWASEVISRQVDHMVRLVDDLLDISRISGGKIQLRTETVDARSIIGRAVETSRPVIDARKHTLNLCLPSEPLPIKADPVRLAQVLANLLNNAAKFTQAEGTIELELARSGTEAIFSIRDNGIGISAEKLLAVFDPFTQVDQSLDRAQGGLGIGLTLVRRLVEMHGGSVRASSEGANRGSQFVIRLPALDEPLSVKSQSQPPARPLENLPPRRILVVDDYPRVAETLMKMLALAGHEVRIALDGPAALEEFSTFQPEVVVLDIGLPAMDGYEVARQIRNAPNSPAVTLIAVTGYGQQDDRRRSREAGFDHHLTKPVDSVALLELIASNGGNPDGHESSSPLLSPA
jgi:signal transduction histidine kinase/DNA-binding response OmpR family regulator